MKLVKKAEVVILAFALLVMPALVMATAHAEVSVNDVRIPFAMDVFNPGAAEWVHLTGYVHTLMIDFNGYTYRIFQSNLQGVSGIGETSGDKYRATTVSTTVVNGEPGQAIEMTTTYNFRLIGPGQGNNYLVHSVFHITVNANGELTATVVKSWTEVK